MSDLAKKAVKMAIIGLFSGIGIGLFFCAITLWSGGDIGSGKGLFIYFLLSGMLGVATMGGSVIYEIESWSITKCTVTHFILTMIAFYLFGSWIGFIKFGELSFWIYTAGEVTAYIIIWVVQYTKSKKEVAKMNEELKAYKEQTEEKID